MKKIAFFQKIISWIKSFAQSKYSKETLFIVSAAESAFSPIPIDSIFIPLCLAEPKRSLNYAFWSSIGSVLGGALGYLIGKFLMDSIGVGIIDFYNAHEQWKEIAEAYKSDIGIWFVALAALTPIPYKIATIGAGATEMNFISFIIVSIIGRAARFYLIAGAIYFLGEKYTDFFNKYKFVFILLFVILFIGGFVAITFFF